ncbi:hypothetical protein [Altericista sp. CCNU0014]|uniref:hypothetical protein n=1 Tax=Altericista sp. CCNU0014 TaxID=3082949 RepID=UPI00384A669F
MSQKHYLFADTPEQLRLRGVNRLSSQLLISTNTTVSLPGEWLEAFWCEQCQESRWYYVQKTGDRSYEISLAPEAFWRQVSGVIDPKGNPSVGEFTRTQSRMTCYQGLKGFNFVC